MSKISLDPLLVRRVFLRLFGLTRKDTEVTDARNPISGLACHLQGVRIQPLCHLQPQEPLDFLYFSFKTTRPLSFPLINSFTYFSGL